MTKKAVRLLLLLLAALLAVYFCYQVYMVAYPAYKTEIALAETVSDTVQVQGIVVRDETVIDNRQSGVVNFLIEDGDKVADGAAVAEIYGSVEAAKNALRLKLLENNLSVLSKAADLGRTSGSNLDYIYSQISRTANEYSKSLADMQLGGLADYRTELTRLINSFQTTSGGQIDFSGTIAALEAEIRQCREADHTVSASIYAPQTGYFISTVDGFESRINVESVRSLEAPELMDLLESANSGVRLDDSHCKVVSDYTWMYAALVPKSAIGSFAQGARYTIDFQYAQVTGVPVTVSEIHYRDGDDYGVVVFACSYLNPSITKLRCETGTVVFTDYVGIKVARSALRLVDGVQGVYIKYGSTVAFRRIDKLFETDDFILSKPGSSDSDLLALYDEIITEGKDLYVGKELGN